MSNDANGDNRKNIVKVCANRLDKVLEDLQEGLQDNPGLIMASNPKLLVERAEELVQLLKPFLDEYEHWQESLRARQLAPRQEN